MKQSFHENRWIDVLAFARAQLTASALAISTAIKAGNADFILSLRGTRAVGAERLLTSDARREEGCDDGQRLCQQG